MKTKIVNTTPHVLDIKEGMGGVYRTLANLPSRKELILRVDRNETYRERVLIVRNQRISLSTDDLTEAAEISLYETPFQKIDWRISKWRVANLGISKSLFDIRDSVALDALRKDASSRMQSIETTHARLVMLSTQVKICPAQCQNLVQTCLQGVEKVKDAYNGKSEEDIWQLYRVNKLGQLISSLDNLVSTLGSVQDLLQACGSDWVCMALVVSLPLPPPERMSSKFDILVKELHWNLETIQYALHLNGHREEFKWNERKIRFVLRGPEEDMEVEQSRGLASADRVHLLSQLENGSILVPGNPLLYSILLMFGMKSATDFWRDKLVTELRKRLKTTADLSNNCSSIPNCFWINYVDLKLRKKLSGNSAFKSVWKGECFGQTVAIGITEYTTKADVEKEARLMLKVQHPNIVGFLGCAFADDAPPRVRTAEDGNCSAGFLVMELMQEDLRHLIDRRARSQIGNPFTPAVTVDILSQIASAMVHMHSLDIMHRDLKSANCLVNTRSSPNSISHVVKVIDFDRSKELNPNAPIVNHSAKTGTIRWMAPEVWGSQEISDASSSEGPFKVPYTRSADVWSYGMTCYEVITGKLPFHEYRSNGDLVDALRVGKRPSIPAFVSCSEGLKALMSGCWAQEPSDRPDFKAIERDLWTIKYELEIQ